MSDIPTHNTESPSPSLHRNGTALVLQTYALESLDTLVNDLREERIQSLLKGVTLQ